MEDHVLDLIIGEGPSARSIRIDLAPFTLVGATTRAGLLATPLRDRFGIPIRLEFYTPQELTRVLMGPRPARWARLITEDGPFEIAARPRHAARRRPAAAPRARLRRGRRGAVIDQQACGRPRPWPDWSGRGRAGQPRPPLPRALIENYGGGPAGVETLAAAIAEARDAVEDVIEPYLMQQGFIQRTPRGRMACAKAYSHLGLTDLRAEPRHGRR
jgi:Holliday junction DNA helicase RuvB